jgi:hypothetical protein
VRTRQAYGYPTPRREILSGLHPNRSKQNHTDKKRLHAFRGGGAIGWDFKSPLASYDIPSNHNGKTTQKAYIYQILEPIVQPWIEAGHDFVLEKDGDSGHGLQEMMEISSHNGGRSTA